MGSFIAGGHFVISIKASCIDSTAPAEVTYHHIHTYTYSICMKLNTLYVCMYVGGVCPRSEEVAGGAAQAPGATHPGAIRKVKIDYPYILLFQFLKCMYVCMYVCCYRDHAVVVGVYRPPPKKT